MVMSLGLDVLDELVEFRRRYGMQHLRASVLFLSFVIFDFY